MFDISTYGEIELTRGDTARFKVTVVNDVGDEYIPGSGDTLTMTVRRTAADNIVLQKIISAADSFHIRPEDTSGLALGDYVYDVQLTTAGGDVYTVVPPSPFALGQEVTY